METSYIRERITELRMKKGVAEHRMSLEMGHSRSYMHSISSGRSLPSYQELFAICEYLNVTPCDFFDESNPNPPLIQEALEKLKHLSDSDLLLVLTMINRLQP